MDIINVPSLAVAFMTYLHSRGGTHVCKWKYFWTYNRDQFSPWFEIIELSGCDICMLIEVMEVFDKRF